MSDPIIRIAARGDGVSASGKHVPFAVPGDEMLPDGSLRRGPGHQLPPCRHFPTCGGCQLQHLTDQAFADFCRSRVEGALAQHGLKTEVREPHLSQPRSRRRATFRALKAGGRVAIGFNEAGSNRVVNLEECQVLRPELFELVTPLHALLASILPPKRAGEVHLALTDQGVDVLLKGVAVEGLAAIEALTDFCEAHRLARLSIDEGFGPEARYEPRPVTVTFGQIAVPMPVGAFLQATLDGEAALVDCVREAIGGAGRIADLFAGLGTFALSLQGQVTAAEAAREAILALKTAANRAGLPVQADHRDLYRRPYAAKELNFFDAVVLDPPRSGALEQVKELAQSTVPKIAYVSCNPATFARDAEVLVGGGYRLDCVRPVGQFRWSTHVELASAFSRQ